ncbi:DUF4232 domain-containing protein [Nocardia sp. NPDC020380]|uniref:DUF4232 domain-containing protein n=1 Tax=Nocardia sp. NPDC020380 TaxID=3364309 RepID=UPI0037A575B2
MRGRDLRVMGVIAAGLVALAGCSSSTVSSGPTGTPGSTVNSGGPSGTPGTPSTGANDGGQPSATTVNTGAGECRTDQLSASIDDRGGAAMGSIYFKIIFTNNGSAPCTMQGYPGVSYTDGPDGDPIGNPARRDGSGAVAPAVLAPGGQAWAQVRSANGQSGYSTADCKPVQVQGVRIYPPDNKASLFISRPGTECSGTTIDILDVQPVQAGAPN